MHHDNAFTSTFCRNHNFGGNVLEEENVNWDQKGNEYSYF